mmetsp:Transcript_240/g.454  ORF Transcript_240/g.454 Transcript_240/m.454 type:complete len:145 (+) Transcript_240:85-519(+)
MRKEIKSVSLLAIAMAASIQESAAFSNNVHTTNTCRAVSSSRSSSALAESKKGFFANFFEELDAFVDDATSRRLGAGAQYYGKRKSSFYGKDDSNRKKDKNVADAAEDYRGPSNAGYFKWMPDAETGELKPVTRLKEVNIEKRR